MGILEFIVVAVVFTILGFLWGLKFGHLALIKILISKGYIKTVAENDKIRIIRYYE